MTANYSEAWRDILDVFVAAWTPTGHLALYEGIKGEIPTTAVPWARVTVRHTGGDLASLTDPAGLQRFERNGTLFVNIFTPAGENLSEAYTLAKTVSDAYEGATTPMGIWFREVRVNEVGIDGEWFQLNVLINFQYTEIK